MKPSPTDIGKLLPDPSNIQDDLRALTVDDYRQAVDLYVTEASVHPGVRFIGQFGTVSLPGVSDIDLFVVTTDEAYASFVLASASIIRKLPHGDYLFWHPAAVVPLSLMPAVRILHSLDHLHVLWGAVEMPTAADRPALPLAAINTLCWNSFFWHTVFDLRYGKQGLRKLLLVLGNLAQSIAGDYRIRGEAEQALDAIRRGKDARAAIVAAPAAQRGDLLKHSLAESLRQWIEADWAVQEYWSHNVHRGTETIACQLALGQQVRAYFSRDGKGSPRSGSLFQWLKELHWKRRGGIHWQLPACYFDTFTAPGAFEPRLKNFVDPWDAEKGVSGWDPIWLQAIRTYRGALENVEQFSRQIGESKHSILRDTFVTPFGL